MDDAAPGLDPALPFFTGTTLTAPLVPPDAALVALARLVRTAVGASWLGLTPIPAGPRRVVDLSLSAPSIVSVIPNLQLLALLPGGSSIRRFRLPNDQLTLPAVPTDCRCYVLQELETPAGRVGVLELGWRQEHHDPDMGPLDALLPLATLLADDLAVRRRATELQAQLEREVPYLRGELRGSGDLRTLTGDGPAMRAVRLAIQQVARTDSNVLIRGETGTGKELVARAIHQLGPRRERLLVAVNCAALAPSVIASELFGHEAGAFTGATRRRIGRFELAHRGTLFLDEVAELAPDVQVMLLRVLQERSIERVGGNAAIPVDVRLVAATHQDLDRAVADCRFRADLFYRLNVFPIHVPPLRERPEDVPDLARHFLHQFNRRMGQRIARIDPDAFRLLCAYSWPGNVRELENLVERAMIVTTGDVLHVDPRWLPSRSVDPAPVAAGLREVERHSILDALRRARGRIYGSHGAAALLGIKPTTLYGKIRRHGIDRDTDA